MHSGWNGWCSSGLLVGYWAVRQNYNKIKIFGYHENRSRPIHYYGEGLRINYDELSRKWPEHSFNTERIIWKLIGKNVSFDFFQVKVENREFTQIKESDHKLKNEIKQYACKKP